MINNPEDFQNFQKELNDLINNYREKLDRATVIGFLHTAVTYITNAQMQQSMLNDPEQLKAMYTKFLESPGLLESIETIFDNYENKKAEKEGLN